MYFHYEYLILVTVNILFMEQYYKLKENDSFIFFISVIISTLFWLTYPIRPFFGSWLIKILPISVLMYFLLKYSEGNYKYVPAIALSFHIMGDVILELGNPDLLIYGILLFLIGHIFYIVSFIKLNRYSIENAKQYVIFVIAIIIYMIIYLYIILKGVPEDMKAPIAIYGIALTFMVLTSMGTGCKNITLGALLYLISDSVIGYTLFVNHILWEPLVSWPTYYIGQLLIIFGIINTINKKI